MRSYFTGVSAILQDANELEQRSTNKLSLKELLQKVSANMEMDLKELMSASRRTDVSMARAIVAYLAVREMKYPGTEIGRILNISGAGVTKCLSRLPCGMRSLFLWGRSGRSYWDVERGKKILLCRLPRSSGRCYWGVMRFCFYLTGMTITTN